MFGYGGKRWNCVGKGNRGYFFNNRKIQLRARIIVVNLEVRIGAIFQNIVTFFKKIK